MEWFSTAPSNILDNYFVLLIILSIKLKLLKSIKFINYKIITYNLLYIIKLILYYIYYYIIYYMIYSDKSYIIKIIKSIQITKSIKLK